MSLTEPQPLGVQEALIDADPTLGDGSMEQLTRGLPNLPRDGQSVARSVSP